MLAKWFLAAVFAGLVASIPTPAEAQMKAKAAPVKVTIRGTVVIVGPQAPPPVKDDPVVHGCLPPLREYYVEANGQRYLLTGWRFRGTLDDLKGQQVIVTGTLELDTVAVTDVTQPIDDALIEYVKVNIEGTLERDCGVWRVRVGEMTYQLAFVSDPIEAQAVELTGNPVFLTGRLKDGVVTVTDVSPVFLHLLPWSHKA